MNNLNTAIDPKPQAQEQKIPFAHPRGGQMVQRYFSREELQQRHIVYMKKKGLAFNTFKWRNKAIKRYYEFMDQIGVKSLYKLNGDTLLKYFEYLKKRNFAGSVQKRSIKNLKTYYNWLEEENIIEGKNQIFKNQNFSTYEYQQKIAREFIQEKIEIKESDLRKNLNPYIDKFLVYFANKGYRHGKHYKHELNRLITFLEENYSQAKTINQITKNMLAEYQIYIHNIKKKDGLGYSASSRQKKIVVLRVFFRYLVRYDYLDKDPAAILELPRLDRGIPTPIMDPNDLKTFLNAPDVNTSRGLRDRTIMEVFYSTGIRNDELCHLKIQDIDFKDGLIKITHAKGGIGFQRVVPIGKIALKYIKKYIAESRPKLLKQQQDKGDLFINNFGLPISKCRVVQYIKEYRHQSKIKTKITAHSFRVTCATDMLKNGADVRYIQEQLGHRSLRSTQIYTRVYPKDLKKIHTRTHPRKNMDI